MNHTNQVQETEDQLLQRIWQNSPNKITKLLLRRTEIEPKKVYVSIHVKNDEGLIEKNITKAKEYALRLLNTDFIPITPAVTLYDIVTTCGGIEHSGLNELTWYEYCFAHLDTCDELHVLMVPGFVDSPCVFREVSRANKLGIRVRYILL